MKPGGNAGKASGDDRQYQSHCRDVLVRFHPNLRPWSGDGIDVTFALGGTDWTIDVALRTVAEELVVAECRRRAAASKQEEIAGFAYKVELLREFTQTPVAGYFFAKTALQLGTVKVGAHEGIQTVVLAEGDISQGYSLAFHRFDPERQGRLRHFHLGTAPAATWVTGSDADLVVTRKASP